MIHADSLPLNLMSTTLALSKLCTIVNIWKYNNYDCMNLLSMVGPDYYRSTTAKKSSYYCKLSTYLSFWSFKERPHICRSNLTSSALQ